MYVDVKSDFMFSFFSDGSSVAWKLVHYFGPDVKIYTIDCRDIMHSDPLTVPL